VWGGGGGTCDLTLGAENLSFECLVFRNGLELCVRETQRERERAHVCVFASVRNCSCVCVCVYVRSAVSASYSVIDWKHVCACA